MTFRWDDASSDGRPRTRTFTLAWGPDVLGYENVTEQVGIPPKPTSRQEALRCLYIIDGAPIEVITAAYRALAKLHHPDVEGSEEYMKVINEAYDILKEK